MKNNQILNSDFESLKTTPIFRIVIVYAIAGVLYIYLSDYAVDLINDDSVWRSSIQTYKGIAFILFTSVLLFMMIKSYSQTIRERSNTINVIKEKSIQQLNEHIAENNAMFEHSPLPIWIIDFETMNFLHVNDAACELYGYSREEYLKMNLLDLIPDEDKDQIQEIFNDSFESINKKKLNVVRHKKKDDEIIQVKLKISTINLQGKKVRLASAIDISEEIKIQDILLEKNSILEQTSEIAGLGYWTYYIEDEQLKWSDQLYRIFEQDPIHFDLTTENIAQCFHEEDKIIFGKEYLKNLEIGLIYETERRIFTPKRKLKWIYERMYLSPGPDGKPYKLQGIAVDISNRKKHEQELKDSNERFKLLAKATVEAVIDWDIKQKKIFWGEGFKNIFGYEITDKTPNRLWMDNIHHEDRESVLKELNEAINNPSRKYFTGEYRFMKANGAIARVQHRGIMIRNNKGIAIRMVGAMIDLTETLNHVYKIEQQNIALRDISWTQSHLVRSPLTNIMGIVSLLKESEDNPELKVELMNYLEVSANKLDKIIRDIVHMTLDNDATS